MLGHLVRDHDIPQGDEANRDFAVVRERDVELCREPIRVEHAFAQVRLQLLDLVGQMDLRRGDRGREDRRLHRPREDHRPAAVPHSAA